METQNKKEKEFIFFKNLALIILFFAATPIVILTSLFSLISLGQTKPQATVLSANAKETSSGVRVYASLPGELPTVSSSIETADARIHLISQYLEYYNSPLMPHSELIVKKADEYGIDYRLLTAIAQQESNLCKKIPEGSYNCWGWGIHSKGTLMFSSYEEAIDIVTKGVKEEYVDKGFVSPEEIMSKYTPSSTGSWANGVNIFMEDMETYD